MSVCNLLVAASPAFIQQESAAARNGRQLAFYQIMLTCFSVSVIAFSAAVPYNRKANGMQAANSEAKGAQRHAVLAANFEEHALASPSKALEALCRAAKAQS